MTSCNSYRKMASSMIPRKELTVRFKPAIDEMPANIAADDNSAQTGETQDPLLAFEKVRSEIVCAGKPRERPVDGNAGGERPRHLGSYNRRR